MLASLQELFYTKKRDRNCTVKHAASPESLVILYASADWIDRSIDLYGGPGIFK